LASKPFGWRMAAKLSAKKAAPFSDMAIKLVLPTSSSVKKVTAFFSARLRSKRWAWRLILCGGS